MKNTEIKYSACITIDGHKNSCMHTKTLLKFFEVYQNLRQIIIITFIYDEIMTVE